MTEKQKENGEKEETPEHSFSVLACRAKLKTMEADRHNIECQTRFSLSDFIEEPIEFYPREKKLISLLREGKSDACVEKFIKEHFKPMEMLELRVKMSTLIRLSPQVVLNWCLAEHKKQMQFVWNENMFGDILKEILQFIEIHKKFLHISTLEWSQRFSPKELKLFEFINGLDETKGSPHIDDFDVCELRDFGMKIRCLVHWLWNIMVFQRMKEILNKKNLFEAKESINSVNNENPTKQEPSNEIKKTKEKKITKQIIKLKNRIKKKILESKNLQGYLLIPYNVDILTAEEKHFLIQILLDLPEKPGVFRFTIHSIKEFVVKVITQEYLMNESDCNWESDREGNIEMLRAFQTVLNAEQPYDLRNPLARSQYDKVFKIFLSCQPRYLEIMPILKNAKGKYDAVLIRKWLEELTMPKTVKRKNTEIEKAEKVPFETREEFDDKVKKYEDTLKKEHKVEEAINKRKKMKTEENQKPVPFRDRSWTKKFYGKVIEGTEAFLKERLESQ
uniref:Uncharacterized protein n=1 Tax=Caenorhabditis tropicalis TaxID=1561998 RepID=A0A1I7TTX5_9PELO